MSPDSPFLQGMAGLFSNVWRIFTSIKFPGTNFTFAHLLLFLIFVPLTLGFFKSLLGFGGLNSGNNLIRSADRYDKSQRGKTK